MAIIRIFTGWLARHRAREFARGQAWAQARIATVGAEEAAQHIEDQHAFGARHGPFERGAWEVISAARELLPNPAFEGLTALDCAVTPVTLFSNSK